MLAAHGESAVAYGLWLPECETGLQLSSMCGWKPGLRAEWNGAAARRSRSAITRGGMGGLWMSDSRIPASVVAKFWIAKCNFRSRFGSARRTQNGSARRTQNGAAWRTSYYFPFRKVYWKRNGNRSVERFAGPPGGPILGPLWSILDHPFSTRATPYPRLARSTPATKSV